jgi:hypothetical protein
MHSRSPSNATVPDRHSPQWSPRSLRGDGQRSKKSASNGRRSLAYSVAPIGVRAGRSGKSTCRDERDCRVASRARRARGTRAAPVRARRISCQFGNPVTRCAGRGEAARSVAMSATANMPRSPWPTASIGCESASSGEVARRDGQIYHPERGRPASQRAGGEASAVAACQSRCGKPRRGRSAGGAAGTGRRSQSPDCGAAGGGTGAEGSAKQPSALLPRRNPPRRVQRHCRPNRRPGPQKNWSGQGARPPSKPSAKRSSQCVGSTAKPRNGAAGRERVSASARKRACRQSYLQSLLATLSPATAPV